MPTNKKNRVVMLVDMQSFYANIEKSYDPTLKDKPVAVAGDPKIRSGVILAACPIAKKRGVKTAEALWEAQMKCPDLVVVRPRMQLYLDISIEIAIILETFTDLVEPYSIDEIFVEMTGALHGRTPHEVGQLMVNKIYQNHGLIARVGIGPNKVMAKMACDHFAKKQPEGIFCLTNDNMPDKLWPLPIGKMFGVGNRMEHHLRDMGIRTIGQLANAELKDITKRWGINGEVLWQTAHGIDEAPVTIDTHIRRKAIGHSMTLPRDYKTWDEIKIVLRELCEEVARRTRANGYAGTVVTVGVGGSYNNRGSSFSRQKKLLTETDDGKTIYDAAEKLFKYHWDRQAVRSVGVTLGGLDTAESMQLSLFTVENTRDQLNHAIDKLKHRYGNTAVIQAASLGPGGMAMERAKKLGGHYK
ncbi:LOW QUALITY PROTEIN: DNA polymerase IV [Geomicrobium sp. JCM 19039]|nr:LOW QUALITY PROTEIN: DNA polymerase IV [Geomicrobium sp. JCM 19039]